MRENQNNYIIIACLYIQESYMCASISIQTRNIWSNPTFAPTQKNYTINGIIYIFTFVVDKNTKGQ